MSDDSNPRPEGVADPDKLNARIQDILANHAGDMENQIPLNLDPDVLERLSQRDAVNSGKAVADGSTEDAGTDTPKDPDRGRESKTFDMATPENSGIKAWALQMPSLSKEQVTPTQTDKMVYLKAMLNDTPLEFTISLPVGNLSMKIRSVNNHEQDVIFKALDMDQKDNDVAGPAQYVTRLQYYSGLLQITEFNGKNQEAPTYTPDDKFTVIDAANDLRSRTQKYIGGNNWATWQAKLTGLRIFEEKLGYCNRAVIDENFWMPADTN